MNKSFTLIEILVVIVVIGVLSAFILVGMSSITNSANIAKGKAFSNSLRNSLLINLVSEYKLDGNVNDSWGTNNGTMNNFPASPWKSGTDCVSGQCLEFDGVNDYINCGNMGVPANSPTTLEGWFYLNNYSSVLGRIQLFFSSGGNLLYMHSANDYMYTEGADYFGINVSIKKWNHMVFTYSGNTSTAKLYLNGTLSNVIIQAGADDLFALSPLLIGSSGNSFYGYIDEVRIYKQAIPTSQIQQNYYSGLNNLMAKGSIDKEEYNNRLMAIK